MTRVVIILALALTSCGQGFNQQLRCRREAGPMPYAAADLLGPFGTLAAEQQPERRAWDGRVRACLEAMR